ncbi:MAG: hypothetical protein JWO44_337 [Bacteroidetes bacterium]|nr:hypothetical protein [Bacteroidota bacterium]
MLPSKRRAIAYIAGRLSGKNAANVYDYSSSTYYSYTGTVLNTINIYDYTRACYLTGSYSSIYDYETGQFISLTIKGRNFDGYDYQTSSFFTISVSGNSITFYDYQDGSYTKFSM